MSKPNSNGINEELKPIIIEKIIESEGQSSEDDSEWLVTYADIITVLLTFFVLLLSISSIDQKKVEQMQESIDSTMSRRDNRPTPFRDLKSRLDKVAVTNESSGDMSVTLDALGVNIRFNSSSFFEVGAAAVRADKIKIFEQIARQVITDENIDCLIKVEGHTDNVPINTTQYPSNWELSVSRASSVVRILQKAGVDKKNLMASGYADSRPLVPNQDQSGNNIKENQSMNRRVEVFIHRKTF